MCESDDEFESGRDKAYAEVQAILGGRYTLEISATVCATILCQTLALAGESIAVTEELIEEFIGAAIDEMRQNWDLLRAGHDLMSGPASGNA